MNDEQKETASKAASKLLDETKEKKKIFRNYFVVITGCTDPSCEEVDDGDAALTRFCEDLLSGEMSEAEDCGFLAQVDIETGELSVCPFSGAEVEERQIELEGEAGTEH